MRFSHLFSAAIVTLAWMGCGGNNATQFPAGLAPTDVPAGTPPAAQSGDDTPEAVDVTEGQDDTSSYVTAIGYVHGSIADVWTAMKNPAVVVDRHHISSYTVDLNVEPGYDVSFVTHYEIDNVVTVKFDLTWREGLVTGSESAPTAVSVVYQKTYGSTFVSLMEGSIELTAVSDSVTELVFAQRMNASGTTADNIALWTNDMFANIVATVHDQPLP